MMPLNHTQPSQLSTGASTKDLEVLEVSALLDSVIAALPKCSTMIDTMYALHKHLMLTTPYENLSVYYGNQKPNLQTLAMCRKLIAGHRGGYCLELNSLYALLLERLGFVVELRSAKVIVGFSEDSPGANRSDSHLVLVVTLPTEASSRDPGGLLDGQIQTVDGRETGLQNLSNQYKYANWKGRWVCDIGAADYAPMEPMPLMDYDSDHSPALGSGGKFFKLMQGPWLGKPGWFLMFHNKARSPASGSLSVHTIYDHFYFFQDIEYPPDFIERINDCVSQPDQCPPLPFNIEFATLPSEDGSRIVVVGTKAGGYSFFKRDVNGVTVSSYKLNEHEELRQLLSTQFNIVLPTD
ncbi:hypothetical protein BASA61_009639 [Batrachochytrium salamandrivorans]|nr:hypothetical protein BASA61_009639 [Batrachochytrium salamandrivorans]